MTGDSESAEDIAQIVFLDLAADKAGSLPAGVILPGWLYRAATCRIEVRPFRPSPPDAGGKP